MAGIAVADAPPPVGVTLTPEHPMLAQDVDMAITIHWVGHPQAYRLVPPQIPLPETFTLTSTSTDAPVYDAQRNTSSIVHHVVFRGGLPGEFTLEPIEVDLQAHEGNAVVTQFTPPVMVTMAPLSLFGFAPLTLSVLVLSSAAACAALILGSRALWQKYRRA